MDVDPPTQDQQDDAFATKTAHIGTVFAFVHYYGYYKNVLPGLGDRIRQTAVDHRTDWNCGKTAEAIPLMFAVIPKTGYPNTPNPSLSDLERGSSIEPVLSEVDKTPIKVKYTLNRAGHPNKDYSNLLSRITFDSKEYVFTAEIPTILKTLQEMRDDPSKKFSQSDLEDKLKQFKREMDDLLSDSGDKDAAACRKAVVIIEYDDTPTENRLSLSEQIGKEIEKWKARTGN